jgi:hypothetical protein
MGDVELLYAVKDLAEGQKLTPCLKLGYNAADTLVELRKIIAQDDGTTKEYKRLIDDPDVADTVVARWVIYETWAEV